MPPFVLVIAGLPGAGKTTTSRAVAARLERAAHIEADALQYMIISGAAWPDGSSTPSAAAVAQLRLRLHNACLLARSFVEAGFVAVIDDIVLGERLTQVRRELAGVPLRFVMLAPPYEHVRARWVAMSSPFADTWKWIDDEQQSTERVGLWLDTSALDPEATAERIISSLDAAFVHA